MIKSKNPTTGPLLYFVITLFLFSLKVWAKEVVNDVTQLNPISVERVVAPTTIEEIQKIVRENSGKISIGGGRFSMGGQTATEDAVQIDMRRFNKVINLDEKNKKITVQTGILWRDLQEVIDPKNLSIKIMQTYSNFTVGGSLSVNVHGRYIGQGPLIRSVDSLKVVLADGELVDCSPQINSEVFYGVIGGYGGLGVIVEATLQLVDNGKVERTDKVVKAKDYKDFFMKEIRDNKDVIFHNGDIYPPEFESVHAVSWVSTDAELTNKDRLIPRNQKYSFQPTGISVLTSIPKGNSIRQKIVDPLLFKDKVVTWRNHEASYDVAELEPKSRKDSTYVLQEYFVPVQRFDEFVPKMRDVFKRHKVNVFNVSIRHALPDSGSIMAWAREEVFAFVVYYKQGTSPKDREDVGVWTREMIDQVLSVGGTYYLPYQPHATIDQFKKAYPRASEFFKLKKRLDPTYKFRNKLWDKYYQILPETVQNKIKDIKDYSRREEQTFLGLPEWYIVFNGDEYAAFLKNHPPSEFPYWASAKEFWNLKNRVHDIIDNKYPPNTGYNVMLWVIGTSYSIELVIKSVYENTIGRLTELISSKELTQEDRSIQKFHQEYADFVHIYPWYEFDFFTRLKTFWRENAIFGPDFIRKTERKLFFTCEYLVKTAYGWLIKLGTRMSYEVEPTIIHAVITDPENESSSFKEIEVLQSEGRYKLVKVPRYDDFRELTKKLSQTSIRWAEIAGNQIIFLTTVTPADFTVDHANADIKGHSAIPTDSTKKRVLLQTTTDNLNSVVSYLLKNNLFIEHIFDY